MYLRSQLPLIRLHLLQSIIVVPFLYLLIRYADTLVSLTAHFDRKDDYATLSTQNQDSSFDYIIVGAGSAGSIVASRLAENGSIKVLLLEAGGKPSPVTQMPTVAFMLSNRASQDWRYRTVPQKNASMGLNGQVVHWPGGKGLGGSSVINGLIFIRGNIQGYDLMAKRTGDAIWKSENIVKFYKKVETYNGLFDKDLHGKNGDLTIEAPAVVPLTKILLEAGEEMGYPSRDPNAKNVLEEGFAQIESYTRFGRRADTYHATLRKNLHRTNLVVRKFSFVTRLLFRPGVENEVIGVEYERHGKTYTATASKQTILCAGSLSTPKILMLSGIGPKKHLEKMQIPVRVDLPVGQRLQDKYGALVGPFVVPEGYSFNFERDVNISSIYDWFLHGGGLLNSARTEATFAVLSETAKRTGDTYAPNVHSYILSQTPISPETLFGLNFNFNQVSLDYMSRSVQYGDGFFQLVTMSRSVGTGTLQLRDNNPRTPVEIDPKYLQNQEDLRTLVEGIRFSVDVVEKTKAMQAINAHLFQDPFPGCESHEFKSDAYYECLARHTTISAYKYCGTAPIGTSDDPEAVVDSRFRVLGTKGLRVIDGSLLRINEVNTNDVTVRMVGELGASVVKMDWT